MFLTENPQPAALGEHIKAWLPSDSSAAELMAAVAAAANDLTVLTPEQAKRWLPTERRVRRVEGTSDALTSRELEVLRLLAEGLGNKDIAGQLGMSDHTAKFHVAQILVEARRRQPDRSSKHCNPPGPDSGLAVALLFA